MKITQKRYKYLCSKFVIIANCIDKNIPILSKFTNENEWVIV